MNNSKLVSMLGICRKAGRMSLGFDAVMKDICKGRVCIVLLTRELSRRSGDKIAAAARDKSILVEKTPLSMEDVAAVTGKASGIVGITDQGLADTVLRLLRAYEEDIIW